MLLTTDKENKNRRSTLGNSSFSTKSKSTQITKVMYDAVTAELADFKQKYDLMAANYQTLEELVKKQQADADAAKAVQHPPAVPDSTLASLQQQLNERKQDALMMGNGLANLEQRWSRFDQRLNRIEARLDNQSIDLEEQKQYSMRNDLFLKKLKNIPVKAEGESFSKFNKRFDTWIYQTLNNLLPNLESTLTLRDIDTSHVLYEGSDIVLVRFSNRRARNDVFFNKRDLKGNGDRITITEHLTNYRFTLLNKAIDIVGKRNAWSKKCQIYVKIRNVIYNVWSVDEVRSLYGSERRDYSRPRSHDLNHNDNTISAPNSHENVDNPESHD